MSRLKQSNSLTIRLLLMVAFFLWVVMAIWPYRFSVLQKAQFEDRNAMLDGQEYKLLGQLRASSGLPSSDPRRLEIEEKLGSVYWQKNKLLDAESFFEMVLKEHKPRLDHNYDEGYTRSLTNLASVYRDQGRSIEAANLYRKLLEYDQKSLTGNDKRIGRDLSNLGLVVYLTALSTEDKIVRREIYEDARGYLEKAIANFRAALGKDSQEEGNTLSTLALVLRDMGEIEKGAKAKAESQRIRALIKTPCTAP